MAALTWWLAIARQFIHSGMPLWLNCLKAKSGSAAKITARFTICPNCCEALGSRTHGSNSPFLNFKDQGGLFKPSKSVVTICKLTELKIRQLLRQTQGKPPQGEYFSITSIELILYTLSCSSVKVDLDCQRFLYIHSTSSNAWQFTFGCCFYFVC